MRVLIIIGPTGPPGPTGEAGDPGNNKNLSIQFDIRRHH